MSSPVDPSAGSGNNAPINDVNWPSDNPPLSDTNWPSLTLYSRDSLGHPVDWERILDKDVKTIGIEPYFHQRVSLRGYCICLFTNQKIITIWPSAAANDTVQANVLVIASTRYHEIERRCQYQESLKENIPVTTLLNAMCSMPVSIYRVRTKRGLRAWLIWVTSFLSQYRADKSRPLAAQDAWDRMVDDDSSWFPMPTEGDPPPNIIRSLVLLGTLGPADPGVEVHTIAAGILIGITLEANKQMNEWELRQRGAD